MWFCYFSFQSEGLSSFKLLMKVIEDAKPGSEQGLCAWWKGSQGAPRTPIQTHTARCEMGLVAHSNRRGIVFLTISTLPCGLAEGSHSPPRMGKFLRCLVATRSSLPQTEQMCSNIWSGRVYAFKDTTPTRTRQKQPSERLA